MREGRGGVTQESGLPEGERYADGPGRLGTGLRRHGLARRPRALRPHLKRKGLRFTEGNRFDLYECGRAAFPRMLEAIEAAERFVHLESYILRADRVGSRFFDALRSRAEAGVEVRVLYDGVGSRELDPGALDALRRAGADIVEFNPLRRFYPDWAPRRRDHRKLLIIDGAVAFTGGLNLGDEYDAPAQSAGGESGWRDSQLALRGPVVRDLGAVFLESWYRAGGPELPWSRLLDTEPPREGSLRCAVLPDGPVYQRRATRELLIASLDACTERACLTSPYFAPGRGVLDAMSRAADRGVRVELVVAGTRTDHPLLRRGARGSLERLLRRGVRVFEYDAGVLHAKSAVFDGRLAVIGSSNLDRQSLQHNYEVNIVADEGDLPVALEQLFEVDVARSTPLTLETLGRRDPVTRVVDWLANLLLVLLGEGDPRS
jgi:cardiolipin synthase